jgi:hypothetical protein
MTVTWSPYAYSSDRCDLANHPGTISRRLFLVINKLVAHCSFSILLMARTRNASGRYARAAGGKEQRFESGKETVFVNAFQFGVQHSGARCWVIIEDSDEYYLYSSEPDGCGPPNWRSLVRLSICLLGCWSLTFFQRHREPPLQVRRHT